MDENMKLEDLPLYIRKYASVDKFGIIVRFMHYLFMTEEDYREEPSAKKWIKQHGGKYDNGRGYWFFEEEPEIITCDICKKKIKKEEKHVSNIYRTKWYHKKCVERGNL